MNSHSASGLALSGLTALALTGAARADVHVVDSNGFGDFPDIQAAVDAAADGDTILLQRPPRETSRYAGFVIEGKGLSIVGPGDQPMPVGPVCVRGLGSGQQVVLANLDVNVTRVGLVNLPVAGQGAIGLLLEDNAGAVFIQDVRIEGTRSSDYEAGGPGAAAVRATDCLDVVLRECELLGGLGYMSGAGGAGIEMEQVNLALYDSTVTAGAGGIGPLFVPDAVGGDGGAGVELVGGLLYVASCELEAGSGGAENPYYFAPWYGGAGGTGLAVGTNARAYAVDVTVLGGTGGFGWDTWGPDGRSTSGRPVMVGGAPPELLGPSRAAEASMVELSVHGDPGEEVTLIVSQRLASQFRGARAGVSHTGMPASELSIGRLPASGELAFDFTTPDVPAGTAAGLILQVRLGTPTTTRYSAPVHLLVLDALEEPVCGTRTYVDADAPPDGDGSSWGSAYRDLQRAIDSTADCPEHASSIWVAEGVYRPEDRDGFFVYPGVHVYGGFEGSETRLAERDPEAHPVTLDGDLAGDDGPEFAFREDNAIHVVSLGNTAFPSRNSRVDGLHIRGGNGHAPSGQDSRGGGIFASGRCSIVRCLVEDNSTNNWGGGIYCLTEEISVESCRVIGNGEGSGGLVADGMSYLTGTLRIDSSIFAGNEGRGVYANVGELRVSNSTFFANTWGSAPVGLHYRSSDTTVANSIFWLNKTFHGDPAQARSLGGTGLLQLDHSIVHGLDGTLGGEGNLGDFPGFIDPVGPDRTSGTLDDDLHTWADAPGVDAGSNALVPRDDLDLDADGLTDEPLPFDLDGEPRFVDEPTVPDTGEGRPPLVDIGPYERQGP